MINVAIINRFLSALRCHENGWSDFAKSWRYAVDKMCLYGVGETGVSGGFVESLFLVKIEINCHDNAIRMTSIAFNLEVVRHIMQYMSSCLLPGENFERVMDFNDYVVINRVNCFVMSTLVIQEIVLTIPLNCNHLLLLLTKDATLTYMRV